MLKEVSPSHLHPASKRLSSRQKILAPVLLLLAWQHWCAILNFSI